MIKCSGVSHNFTPPIWVSSRNSFVWFLFHVVQINESNKIGHILFRSYISDIHTKPQTVRVCARNTEWTLKTSFDLSPQNRWRLMLLYFTRGNMYWMPNASLGGAIFREPHGQFDSSSQMLSEPLHMSVWSYCKQGLPNVTEKKVHRTLSAQKKKRPKKANKYVITCQTFPFTLIWNELNSEKAS